MFAMFGAKVREISPLCNATNLGGCRDKHNCPSYMRLGSHHLSYCRQDALSPLRATVCCVLIELCDVPMVNNIDEMSFFQVKADWLDAGDKNNKN